MSEVPRKPRPARADTGTDPNYEVGYGRPPLANQFKPGQCGNPKGRPRKPRTLPEAVGRELDRTITVRDGGREKRLVKLDVVARRLVDAACSGDARSIRLLRDIVGSGFMLGSIASASTASAAPPPLDGEDRTILAAFAALIRSGASFSGETIVDPMLNSRNDGGHAVDPDDTPSPTQH